MNQSILNYREGLGFDEPTRFVGLPTKYDLNDKRHDAEISALQEKTGSGTTSGISEEIRAEINRATAAEANLSTRISGNTNSIIILNGTGEGSVQKQISIAIDRVISGVPETFDTLKEIADWIEKHGGDATKMLSAITANTKAIEDETTRAKNVESELSDAISAENLRAFAAESANTIAIGTLGEDIASETERAKFEETANTTAILNEVTRAQNAESDINNAIANKIDKVSGSSLVEDSKVAAYDAHVVNGDIHITTEDKTAWNSKQDAISDLDAIRSGATLGASSIQSLEGYAKSDDVTAAITAEANRATAAEGGLNGAIATKTSQELTGANGKSLMFNETDGGGAKFEHTDGTWSFAGVNDGGKDGLAAQVYAIDSVANKGVKLDVQTKGIFYTSGDASTNGYAERDIEANEIATKGLISSETSRAQSAETENADAIQTVAATLASYSTESESLFSQLLTRIQLLESQSTTMKYADSAEAIESITEPATTNLVVTKSDALEAMTTSKTYKSIAIVGADTNETVTLNASDKVVLTDGEINGLSGATHGKINFATPDFEVKNLTLAGSAYNVFEGTQNTTDTSLAPQTVVVDNITADNTLSHNVMNVYTPANDANITIKNSKFDLNVANSNVVRMSNYLNNTGVTITFDNVDWTYETIGGSESDFAWAGLLIYQPAGKDIALSGDTSAISTWKIVVKNCRYNGTPVTAQEFGTHQQIGYMYNFNKSGKCEDITTYIPVVFE